MRPWMRREDRRVVAVLGFLHGVVHANILSIPIFLLAWKLEFGADDVTLGLLAAAGFGFYGLGAVPFGFLADRRPAGGLLLLCAAGIAISMVGVGASPSIPVLALSLGALGLFSGIYHPTGLSIISRVVAEQGRGMGWHGMGGSLGIAAGPAFVGAMLAIGWSWRSVAALLVIPSLVALLLLFVARLPVERPAPALGSSRSPRPLWSRPFAFILLVYMFAGFAYQGGLTFLPRFVGAEFFALALALGAIGQVVSGRLADRRQSERILFGLSVAAATVLVLLAVLPPGGAFTTAALLFGFLLFSLEPLQNILVTGEVPGPLRGLAFGFTFLSVFGIGSLGAALAGWLIANHASAILFLVLGGFLAASGTASLGARRRFNA